MCFTSIILQEQNKQQSFQIVKTENMCNEQKSRRKSCTCENCGRLNQYQFKHMNVPTNVQQYSKIKTNFSLNFKSLSKRHISFDNIKIGDQISESLNTTKQQKRQKSCDCQQCGMNEKLQKFKKSMKINRQKNKKLNRKQNLEQIFKGISPIRQMLYDDLEIENDKNKIEIFYLANLVVPKKYKIQLVKPQKQIIGGQQRRNILKSEQGKQCLRTNNNNRNFGIKQDTNKKVNLPLVKSSYMKTIEILNIYEVQKYNPKFSNQQ